MLVGPCFSFCVQADQYGMVILRMGAATAMAENRLHQLLGSGPNAELGLDIGTVKMHIFWCLIFYLVIIITVI